MGKLNLSSVGYNISRTIPSYVVSSVVDCDYGYYKNKLISSPEDLDRYYGGLKNREGLISLLDGGASLYLKRLNRIGSRCPSLRLLNNNFRYSHPGTFDFVDYEDLEFNNKIEAPLSPDNISLYETHTFNYVIDFDNSPLLDEDYIAIPSYKEGDSEYDNSVLFYFTPIGPTMKFPRDFNPSVPLSTLGSKSIAIDIPEDEERLEYIKNNRAQIIYEWYSGTLTDNVLLNEGEYEVLGGIGDSNFIPDLSSVDGNKVTLVFKKSVRNIRYYNSGSSLSKFTVVSDPYLNQELISTVSKYESVISFKALIEGEISLQLSLRHVKGFHFELELSTDVESEYHYISLDINEPLYNGRSIYIEDVIDLDSNLMECSCHLGTSIEEGSFTEEEAINLEGIYNLALGNKGESEPYFNEESETRLPFYDSIDLLKDGEVYPNIFLFDEFIEPYYQAYAVENFLSEKGIVSFVNIPELVSDPEEIRGYILEDSYREYLIYTYGRYYINESLINNSYLYSLSSITGVFKNSIPEGSLPENILNETYEVLDFYKINYLKKQQDYYFTDSLVNIDSYLDPNYLIIVTFVRNYLTRFLRSQLGTLEDDLERSLRMEVSKVSDYSNHITRLYISDFTQEYNNLNLKLNMELSELVGSNINIVIKITKD
jgi:hypothetical protein